MAKKKQTHKVKLEKKSRYSKVYTLELAIVQIRKESALCKQFFIRALLHDISITEDEDQVSVSDR